MKRFALPAFMWLFATAFVLAGAPVNVVADDESDTAAPAQPAAAVEKKISYEVPEGGVEELAKYIEKVQDFQPETAAEYLEHRRKAQAAMTAAAKKIIELDPEKKTDAASVATRLLLQAEVGRLGDATPAEQREIFGQVADALKSAKKLSRSDLTLAMSTAQTLDFGGNQELAAAAYETFGELLRNSDDEAVARYGEKMVGAARRVNLLGKSMQLDGTTVEGEPFDWSSYRGKVVLVDSWATWCGPCIGELPNVKAMYKKYHDKGFDVIGISLDNDRERLVAFLTKEQIPWATLFEPPGGWDNPNANYYGVMGIPTVILVDKEGKVVSLNARGEELGRLLGEMLGKPNQADS